MAGRSRLIGLAIVVSIAVAAPSAEAAGHRGVVAPTLGVKEVGQISLPVPFGATLDPVTGSSRPGS